MPSAKPSKMGVFWVFLREWRKPRRRVLLTLRENRQEASGISDLKGSGTQAFTSISVFTTRLPESHGGEQLRQPTQWTLAINKIGGANQAGLDIMQGAPNGAGRVMEAGDGE